MRAQRRKMPKDLFLPNNLHAALDTYLVSYGVLNGVRIRCGYLGAFPSVKLIPNPLPRLAV